MFIGCEKDAFEKTNEGMQTLSCYIDGRPYAFQPEWFASVFWEVCYYRSSVPDKLPNRLYLFTFYAIPCSPINDSDGEIRSLTISVSDTEPLVTGKKYFYNVYEERPDSGIPICYAHFDNYATSGWVEFRKLERTSSEDPSGGIASGDFEFEEPLEEGSVMRITQGTFDFGFKSWDNNIPSNN